MRFYTGFFIIAALTSSATAQTVSGWDALAVTSCERLQPNASNCQDALINHAMSGVTFSGPLVISQGGTYTGAWRSGDSNTAAILINTSDPVTIKDSVVSGPGNLIYGRNINATISNVTGFGTGTTPGKFLDATVGNGKTLIVSGNRLSNVWGIRVSGDKPMPADPATLSIRNNIAYNLRDGLETSAHFIQLVNGLFPYADISGNVSINAPGSSHMEDVISLYNARGTATQPIQVFSNRILGAYPLNAATDSFSGGGIISDGDNSVSSSTSSAYIQIEQNIVIDTTNYGIAIASGNNVTVTNNTVVSSGVFSSNIPVKAQNIGLYIWNINKQPGSVFFNNMSYQNNVYWLKANGTPKQPQVINNAWLPDCVSVTTDCLNTSLSTSNRLDAGLNLENKTVQKYFAGTK